MHQSLLEYYGIASMLRLREAIGQTGSAKLGPGYGLQIKEIKIGPVKAGGGVNVASGGMKLSVAGLESWGTSSLEGNSSIFNWGGRLYLWDIDIEGHKVNNIDVWGGEPAHWDWSLGGEGTFGYFTAGFEITFEPLIEWYEYEFGSE